MTRARVLLSEASRLTAREFLTVLGSCGVRVEVVTASALPIARFSRWCRRVHRVPSAASDPIGYLDGVERLMSTGAYTALLPTHEQAWLFAAGRRRLHHAQPPVATLAAFEQVESKLAFAKTVDELGIPQPPWREVRTESDLSALGFPVWVKAAYSTAGRGVRHARDLNEARQVWQELSSCGVMIQRGASGRYAQVQGVFDNGRLVGAAVSELLATGAGGSAAARLSVDHPRAVDALTTLGEHLDWHGGIGLDYFHRDGEPVFIECNPRITEPGNAARAGVNLPALLTDVATGAPLPHAAQVTRAGVRTRSTMAIALGTAETRGTRWAVASSVGRAVTRRPPLRDSTEVLTPVLRDPPSIIPFALATGSVLVKPSAVSRLAGGAVSDYSVTPEAIRSVTHAEDRGR